MGAAAGGPRTGATAGGSADGGDGTVGKALEVLDLVASFGRPVRFAEMLAASRFPKASLHRFAQTLARQGMLTFDPGTGLYGPGVRLVRLAHAAWRQASLAPVARPHIDRLATATGRTVHLAQLDRGQVLYLDKRSAAVPVEMFSAAGKVGPAYCTGVGKAMLAFLDEEAQDLALQQQAWFPYTPATITGTGPLRAELARVRREGMAIDREEHEAGILCLAMPILSDVGGVVGAVSITASTASTDADRLLAFAEDLRDAVGGIAADWAVWRAPDMD